MGYVTKEQIEAAKEMDLFTYLENYDRGELVHFGGSTYTTRTHDGLKISNGKWMWWSRGIGGRSALDYLIKVKGYRFTDAVEHILQKTGKSPPVIRKERIREEERKAFALPPKNGSNHIARAYLLKRGIDEELTDALFESEAIYESRGNHNVIFTGKDENGEARYAFFRATDGRRIMGEAAGSDKRFSFRLADRGSDTLHVFESAIDLLSFATMAKLGGKDYRKSNYISLSGVYIVARDGRYKMPVALEHFLETNRNIRNICLRLDNDRTGILAAEQIKRELQEQYEVYILPPKQGKDYNEFLQIMKGLKREINTEREDKNGR